MITLEKIRHRDEERLKVILPFSEANQVKIKQVPGRKWSKTLQCWHVPDTEASLAMLEALFERQENNKSILQGPENGRAAMQGKTPGDGDEETKASKERNTPPSGEAFTVLHPSQTAGGIEVNVRLILMGNAIKIFLPKKTEDTLFITSLKYYQWKKTEKCWQVPNYPAHLEKLKTYFGARIKSIEIINPPAAEKAPPIPDESTWHCVEKTNGRIVIYAQYFPPLHVFLKSQPYPYFDGIEKLWSIARYEGAENEIRQLAEKFGKKVTWEIEKKENRGLPRPDFKSRNNYRRCPDAYVAKMRQLNYTQSSIDNYVPLFEEFINYYPAKLPEDISPPEIEAYMQYLVMERKYGTSCLQAGKITCIMRQEP
jgi:integrase/recombinase XerD